MAYDDDESSQAAGAPIEGYEFIGSATTWRYTSHVEAVTIDGDTYTPIAGLRRSSVGLGSTNDTPVLKMALPVTSPVVQHYAFATPPRTLQLNVWRYQPVSGEWKRYWHGEVTSIAPKGPSAEVTSPSNLAARLSTNVPGLTVRTHCSHFLYDARCRVARAGFDHTTTVASVNGTDARIITVAGVGAFPDQYFKAGEIVRDSDGERRSIIDQVGAVLKVASAFRTLANPDVVTLYAGCDHTAATCETKFSNTVNFGGFPRMPKRNPFRVAITLGDD
jgi:uncharacterized phage protein (TIGR02218 family)